MGNVYEVGILMRGIPSTVQRARELGRPIFHEDSHAIPVRQFFLNIATRNRGWHAPQGRGTEPVKARLDSGRWLADCPLSCGGAEQVSQADPVFYCLSCGSGGKWWDVEFPSIIADINDEVIKRPDVKGWSWNPALVQNGKVVRRAETLRDLQRETKRMLG